MNSVDSAIATMASVGDYVGTILSPENLMKVSGKLISILFIWFIASIALRFSEVMADRLITNNTRFQSSDSRAKTIGTLVKSIVRYTVYFMGGVMALQQLGIPVTSLLTAAGIGGLAIGFGAQNLVRDIITGFFILLEEQYNVGDYVEIGGKSGVVEEMGIRTTKVRDFGGQLHIIPNGNVSQVTNYMGPRMRVQFDIRVSYDTDLDKAIEVIQKAIAAVADRNQGLFMGGPSVLGVEELADSSINIRVWAQTQPMQQWLAGRLLRKQIKEDLDAAGIEIPFPYRTVLIRPDDSIKA